MDEVGSCAVAGESYIRKLAIQFRLGCSGMVVADFDQEVEES